MFYRVEYAMSHSSIESGKVSRPRALASGMCHESHQHGVREGLMPIRYLILLNQAPNAFSADAHLHMFCEF